MKIRLYHVILVHSTIKLQYSKIYNNFVSYKVSNKTLNSRPISYSEEKVIIALLTSPVL